MNSDAPLAIEGKVFPLTVLTPIRRGQVTVTRLFLRFFGRFEFLELRQLQFIHFARWQIIRLPHERHVFGYRRRSSRYYLLFTSNFNGPWEHYIDTFSLVNKIRRGMDFVWSTSCGFPGARPLRRFKRYIRYHEYVPDYYYSAYPHASVRDIHSADRLAPAAEALDAAAAQGDAAAFRHAFDALLAEHAADLRFTPQDPNRWSEVDPDDAYHDTQPPTYQSGQPYDLAL